MGSIVVVGSSNTDMIIQAPRIPAPGETVLGGEFSTAAGGKGANQAVAAARAGGTVSMVACLGADIFGEQTLARFRDEGIDTACCRVVGDRPSGVALIVVAADGENSIAVAPGANACLGPEEVAAASAMLGIADVVLAQLEVPLETIAELARRVSTGGALMMLNPAPAQSLPDDVYPLLDIITPNETEALLLTGIEVTDESTAALAAGVFHQRGVETVVITRGSAGVHLSICSKGASTSATNYPAYTVEPLDTTAAGDVFNGCLAMALAAGQPVGEAIAFSQAASALSVQVLGAQTSAPTETAVREFMASYSG